MTDSSEFELATFGAGCFWCVEAVFKNLNGVHKVESGYMGGETLNPTYRDICTGTSGHAEVTQITYDPAVISFEVLLEWLWRSHDPTTLNRQGGDGGTQYRSAIFCHSADQYDAANASIQEAQANFDNPIVTEVTEAATFYKAEEYHQDYYNLNRAAPYCQMVILPKLQKLDLEQPT
jgi:peptide-methionine (S)-S-oxide reductase